MQSLLSKMRIQIPRRFLQRAVAFSFIVALPGFAQTATPQLPTTSAPATTPTTSPILTPEQKKLMDWPNLARYRDADRQLLPPAPGESRVVFIGDSITDVWNLAEFFPGKPYVNRGISGQTTPQMLIRFRPDVIALKPTAVVILAGTNDIAENTGPTTPEAIQDNIRSMVDLAKANGIRVVLCSILPAYDFPWHPGLEPAEKIIAMNAWIKGYAEHQQLVYLDYFSSMVDDRHGLRADLSRDGVHPNKAGYVIMQGLAEKAIAQVLGTNP
jgi:lysophospholipase L1-like esterase